MKRNLLIIAIMTFAIQLASGAAVSVDKTITEDYLLNNGYSKQVYNTVQVSRARALGEEFYSSEELDYMNAKWYKKWWNKFRIYIDPAQDNYTFYHHDTENKPSIHDL